METALLDFLRDVEQPLLRLDLALFADEAEDEAEVLVEACWCWSSFLFVSDPEVSLLLC
jgi:hypothetical protein